MTPSPFILQTLVEMPRSNPVAVIIGLVIVILAVITLFLIFGSRGVPTVPTGRGFTRSRFRRVAAGFGLDNVQIKTLENLIAKFPMANPYSLLTSPTALDNLLRKAVNELKQQPQSEPVREAHKATLFRIKQLIEQNSKTRALSGSQQLVAGQGVTVTGPDGVRYPSRVASNLRDYVALDIPTDDAGAQVRWKKWTPIQIFSWKPNGQGFSFETRVAGYNAVRGIETLLISQTKKVQQAIQRKFRRKPLEKPAYFYAVQVMTVGEGRDQKKRAVPQTKGALGTVLDVSAGGCSLRSSFPLARGSLIKVEFETAKNHPIVVFGKVKQVRKVQPIGGIMHIQFTQVSKMNLNKINQFVYEIG